jgi:hypothetical protein
VISTPEKQGFIPQEDSALLALAAQFATLTAELAAAERLRAEFTTCQDQQVSIHDSERAGPDAGAWTKQVDAILARLYPIEQAIMQTPACTVAGLGVKARHAAYVMSGYWEEPVDQIDWEAQAIRLLIEAVCDVARTPLPFQDTRGDK